MAKLMPLSPWSWRYADAIRTHDAFVARLANEASGIICGRFRVVCIALRMQLSFLAIAGNTSKVESLLAEAGLSGRFIDLAELTSRPEPPRIPPFSYEERQAIAPFADGLLAKACRKFAEIADDAGEIQS